MDKFVSALKGLMMGYEYAKSDTEFDRGYASAIDDVITLLKFVLIPPEEKEKCKEKT